MTKAGGVVDQMAFPVLRLRPASRGVQPRMPAVGDTLRASDAVGLIRCWCSHAHGAHVCK